MSKQFQLQLINLLKQYPLKQASLFGSFGRGDEDSSSDIDILIEPESGFTLFDMLRMEQALAKKLKRKVDLVEFSAIKPSLRERILQQAVSLI
ncbi:MAG: nucleotidyltransferase family protein [Bacteroidetes bacterium]|nr:nucleotidyltransferase family protein [Bacteroidota bacterium]